MPGWLSGALRARGRAASSTQYQGSESPRAEAGSRHLRPAQAAVRITRTALASAVLLLTGCTMYAEGQGFAHKSDEEDWQEIRANLSTSSALPETELATEGADSVLGAIAVGRVGPFRSFADEDNFEKAYRFHVRKLTELGLEDKVLSREELHELAVGWTTVTFQDYFYFFFDMVVAYVPHEMAGDIDYPSKAGTVFFGTREDMVVARLTVAEPYWVVSERLCELEKGFHLCADRHPKGLYDAVTGRQLNRKYALKTRGRTIDTNSLTVR